MDIDQLMSAPGMRWVFRVYAIAAAAAGVLLFLWGPLWLGVDLPGLPFYKASLVRVAGGVLMAVACCVAALDGLEDPRARRRALLWLGIGHTVLFLVVLSQRLTIWHDAEGKIALLVLFAAMFAFYFFASGAEVDTSCRNQLTGLFGPGGSGSEKIQQRYERQIRAAALQEERHRLARDLHDSVKQQIFVIQTAAATAQTRFEDDPNGARAALGQLRAAARDAMAEMEAMLDQLRAAPLESVGFVESVRKQAEALGLRTGAKIDFQVGGTISGVNLAPGAQETLFRIAQEAFANIGRHARAGNVTVAIFGDPHFLRLTIQDDGQGFDTGQPARGMGLANMRSRSDEFGGTLELTSAPGRGTCLTAGMPVVPQFSMASYRRRLFGYGVGAALFFLFALWQHSLSNGFLGFIFAIYAIRVALGRSAALRRPETVR
jgi:signal transduction histidine kinase